MATQVVAKASSDANHLFNDFVSEHCSFQASLLNKVDGDRFDIGPDFNCLLSARSSSCVPALSAVNGSLRVLGITP